MNIAYFLTPKASVAYLYDDCTFRQGLEKMRRHGYTAIPVITREGRYVGTVSEGDFLWQILGVSSPNETYSMRDMEKLQIRDILKKNRPPVRITVSMEDLLSSAMTQNFVPVVDDLGNFTGIVTRQDILRYFSKKLEPELVSSLNTRGTLSGRLRSGTA
jgi:CBS domain-containing protein